MGRGRVPQRIHEDVVSTGAFSRRRRWQPPLTKSPQWPVPARGARRAR